MKTWQKILILTLISFAIGGLYLLSVWKHRQDPGEMCIRDRLGRGAHEGYIRSRHPV